MIICGKEKNKFFKQKEVFKDITVTASEIMVFLFAS